MIQANELRIGNFLIHVNGEIEKVHSVRYINGRSKINGAQADQFNPIPLTEEWLVNLGAEEVGIGTNLFEYDRFYLRWHPQFKYWYVTQLVSGEYITKVEFVHEWQNLVFALNGEELEVKK